MSPPADELQITAGAVTQPVDQHDDAPSELRQNL
jgi:hypothetical protein